MSHALSDSETRAEPNLVPLLDLVFQLIMFFMICVNFVSSQVDRDIQLPIAQSARAMDKGEFEVLVLNMDRGGKIHVVGQPAPLSTLGEKRYFLRQSYADAQRTAQEKDKKAPVTTTIIVRADKESTYLEVYELLNLCKEIGFRKLQLRAYSRAEG
jgi:biopolymer transport protein ExbD